MDSEKAGLLLGFLGATLGLIGIGTNMTGRPNRLLGNALLLLGLVGSIVAFAWAFWPIGWVFVGWSAAGILMAGILYFLQEIRQYCRQKIQRAIDSVTAKAREDFSAQLAAERQETEHREHQLAGEIQLLSERLAAQASVPPSPKVEPLPPGEQKASSDSIEGLRSICGHWYDAFRRAEDFVSTLASHSTPRERQEVQGICSMHIHELEMGFKKLLPGANQADFNRVAGLLEVAIRYCHDRLIEWVEQGEESFGSEKHKRFLRSYAEAWAELSRYRFHSELWRLQEQFERAATLRPRQPQDSAASTKPPLPPS